LSFTLCGNDVVLPGFYVVGDALDEIDCAVLLPDLAGFLRDAAVGLHALLRNGNDETIYVAGHALSPSGVELFEFTGVLCIVECRSLESTSRLSELQAPRGITLRRA
jgi:hypothetical protein